LCGSKGYRFVVVISRSNFHYLLEMPYLLCNERVS
jgi:hypothetical protein